MRCRWYLRRLCVSTPTAKAVGVRVWLRRRLRICTPTAKAVGVRVYW